MKSTMPASALPWRRRRGSLPAGGVRDCAAAEPETARMKSEMQNNTHRLVGQSSRHRAVTKHTRSSHRSARTGRAFERAQLRHSATSPTCVLWGNNVKHVENQQRYARSNR